MNTNSNINYYRTDDIALAPYLAMKDLKYCVGELDNSGKVFFVFKDPENIGNELEFGFNSSALFRYNILWKKFRGKLDKFELENKKKDPNINYYETDRLALAPYLVMRDLKYSHMEQLGRKKIFYFEDPLFIGQELLMDFEKSEETTYNKYWHIFRKEVEKTKSNVKLGLEDPIFLKNSRAQK